MFKDDVDRILNSPMNKIKGQVLDYMSLSTYNIYAEMIFPIDRTSTIYEFNYKNLTALFQANKDDFNLLDDRDIDKRNEVLTNGMVYIHNFLSSQFSLFDILERHEKKLSLDRQLLKERKNVMNDKVTTFFRELRNNIIHQNNFGPSLRFDSKWGHTKIIYSIPELLKSDRWKDSRDYILSFGDHVIIEDLINEHYNYITDFLSRYEAILFDKNKTAFHEVVTTFLAFAKQYKEIGERGFLPVSELYWTSKLRFFPYSTEPLVTQKPGNH